MAVSLIQYFTSDDIPLKLPPVFTPSSNLNDFIFKKINEWQLQNIYSSVVIFEVSKFDKSKYFRL